MAVFLELLAAFWTLAGTTPSAVDRPPGGEPSQLVFCLLCEFNLIRLNAQPLPGSQEPWVVRRAVAPPSGGQAQTAPTTETHT